ncbi:hypothetical protein AX769_13990 [Frondihabitans sp. PAMC 28766]|uniref:DUF58 domain-containing protein n=1 Tax=Frondihabitans sp. PAMC 28766 TaxID=1795630 RepID=UPI00078C1B64|nr:DUF58 domain-containing protein [Frondihabitans sp. PAMC 28766]AMM21044.1 hypothetical protein AX769_13990 [Frondihabitans sp. PAMC 28766]
MSPRPRTRRDGRTVDGGTVGGRTVGGRTETGLTGRTGLTGFTGRTGYSTVARTPRARRRRALRRARSRFERRTRRVFRAVTGVVTPLGWAVVAAAVVAGIVGLVVGWLEFEAIGASLGILVLVALLFLIGRARYEVSLVVDSDRTVVGHPVAARVALGASSRRPHWGARLEVQVGEQLVPLRLPSSIGGEASSNEFEVPADRRGVVQVGPVRTVRGDPVGLFRRDVEWTTVHDVHVHPETITVPSSSTGFVRDLEGSPTRDLTASDISFHALRDFRPGDDRRHIHWKSTARTGTLTVRQFEETRRSHVVVAFSLAPSDYLDGPEFELAVGAASSLALRAIRDGRDITALTSPPRAAPGDEPSRSPRILSTRSRSSLLDDVSTLVADTADIDVGGLAALANDLVVGVSLVFLVCGSAPSLRDLRSWSLRFPPGVEIVAVVCRPGAVPGLRRLGELSVLEIGYLDDLRRALAKAAAA